ncbi:hypothetical protein FHR83_005430 [Actinoplanes campanulatus]|jgi:hypothetical protein|uniref:Peptidase inhibitor family I36 n=1 Tax=Actinoplanes campanulatus TaxID=113559 RepID=A0A7W5AKF9_9ACTN|nr:peptidase inhibitor family I36 protein [Actinoplanes campanulatus]MBB3097746.1 hypothetical protein [Actinoplanes campanulatus]GGN38133.1 hypothetical protein GCM10010109_64710 [Actinoplanes campanulatus]GID39683.1 hypothetical protein Aca09nite_61890 [Actinoplanes campanulatus]
MKRRTAAVAALIVAVSIASAVYAVWPTRQPAPPPTSQLDSTGQGTFHRKDGVPLLTVINAPATPASPDCPAHTLCLYAGPDFGYPRVTTTACGHIDLRWIGWARRPRSIHNNLPAGGHPNETVGFFRSDADTDPPSEATEHLLLTLTASTRTADNVPPDIDWLYHRC